MFAFPKKAKTDEHEIMRQVQADFGLGLLRETSNFEKESKILSPISISMALAMCHVGARNNTADEIGKVIGGGIILPFFSSLSHDFFRCFSGRDSQILFRTYDRDQQD